MSKVILFYSPFDHRSRDTESLMIAFRRKGHRVISLSQESGKDLHDFVRPFGIETYTHILNGKKNSFYFFRQLIYFIFFCRKHKVDIVFSHLEPASYVASVGQYFISSRVFLCRHHVDEGSFYGYDKLFSYRLTYYLAKEIIVVSELARRYMIDHEKIPSSKIIMINLAYDFSLYDKPDMENVKAIREQYGADVLLVTVGRLTKYKRPDVSVRTLKLLTDKGINAALVILGRGPMKDTLDAQVRALNLEEKVHSPGHVRNVMDYMQACDFLLHPSLSESSCVVIKEAGLAEKPVIVCEGVGDFDSYLRNGSNGFLISGQNFEDAASQLILQNLDRKEHLHVIGSNLKSDVLRLFDVNTIIDDYTTLIER